MGMVGVFGQREIRVCRCQQPVAQATGLAQQYRAERVPDSRLGVVGPVDRVMQPPCPVIVPQVVVGVAKGNPNA